MAAIVLAGALLACLAWPTPASAGDGFQEACVTGVSSGSALSVRAGPSRGAAVLGTIPAGACGVRVAGACDAWCTVSYPPANLRGEASARFLRITGAAANPNLPSPVDYGLFELRDPASGAVFAVASVDLAGELSQDLTMTLVMTSGPIALQGAVFVSQPGSPLQGGVEYDLWNDGAARESDPPLSLFVNARDGHAALFGNVPGPATLELVKLRRDGDAGAVYRIARDGGVYEGVNGPGVPPAAYEPPTPSPQRPVPSPGATRGPSSGAWHPRFGGDRVTFWNHNGSGMAWESRGDRRWVWYWNVREGLRASGITRGTLLFEGRVEGDRMVGRARTFSRSCGENPYPVTGVIAPGRERVVMRGSRARLDDACRTIGRVEDVLSFEYIEASPDPASGAFDTGDVDAAFDLPAFGVYADRFRVSGVSDVLNIRIAPSSSSTKIGALPAQSAGFFVNGCTPDIDGMRWEGMSLAARNRAIKSVWCQVEHRGASGYVSGRYLSVLPRP